MILCGCLVLILIVVIIIAIKNVDNSTGYGSSDSYTSGYYFESADKISNSVDNCNTYTGAKKQLEKLDNIISSAKISGQPDRIVSYIETERKDIQEYVDCLERSEWEEKADSILSCFLSAFQFVTTEEYHSFRNIEDVLRASKNCVRLWNKYWESVEGVHADVNPKEYMRKYLGDSFEPCMQESEQLKKRLNNATDKLKPENKRKKKLYDDIIKTVADSGTIMQCQLKNHEFENATRKEVDFCYNDLIAQYRLVKVKIGNRYFVSLSDKEKERLEKLHSK